jgi:glycosyltransferase involved in cell wall biosynthesis
MPIYNAGHQLRLAVLSIVRQTFHNWELLIIDDGSTDDALQGISDIQDPRIRIIRDGANKGLTARLNEAIDLAQGEYFARMDQDDVSYPERFACQVEMLERDPELDMIAVRTVTISDDNELVGSLPFALTHEEICAKPWRVFYMPHPTWMGHLSWFRTHRYATYFCEDQELLLRSHAESRFATVDEVLFGYRVRQRINWKKQVKTHWILLNIQLRHFLRSKQFFFFFMSLPTFAGRVAGETFKLARQNLPGQPHSLAEIDSTESRRWRRVLKDTLGETES